MYTLIKYLILFSILYLSHAAEEDVLDLVDSDFATTLQSHETTLVMFYAPWCGHCKRLKPEYAQAAGILSRDDPPITLAKVDCTEGGKGSCEKYSVTGYPTLKIFRNGEMSQDYNGPRESGGIVKYMRAQVGPSSKDLKTVEEYEAFIGKDEVAVIGYFAEETDLKGDFLKAADKLREEIRFGHSSNSAVLTKAGFKNHIVLYRPKHLQNKFEDSNVIFPGDANETPIKVFIKDNVHGLVGHRQKDNIADFKNPLIVAYYGVDYIKNLKGTNYWRNRILKVAKDFSDLNFAISNKDEFTHELNEFGIDFVKGEKPVVLGRDAAGNKFIMQQEFDVEKLQQFAQELLDGNLEAFVKSEPVPESNDGPVTIAVGKNFQDVVIDNDKDTLIEFYAPWCGHCQKLSPIWDELGEKMKDEDIAIVKMDATANDWPKSLFEVSGFPTLYWKPKDNSKPIRYNGGRSLDDFINYIAEHSSSGLKGWDKKGNVKKEEL